MTQHTLPESPVRTAPDRPATQSVSSLHLWAASLAIEAGLVHVFAGQDHFREWWGYGLFFLIVSLCQFGGGVALIVKSSRGLYWTGIVGTAVVLAIWTISRTVGVRIGPEGVGPEPVGFLDAICSGLEVALVWCLVRLLRDPDRAPSKADGRG